jgi:hypothetical protein
MKQKPPPRMTPPLKEEFREALTMQPDELQDIHVRALIKRVAQLSDDERYKFRHVLVRENLTEAEMKQARASFSVQWFQMYFPFKADVEQHYVTTSREGGRNDR